ncbi:hypothetical protein DOY81_008407 [Sarcophaga bullata]|nr:hypothetical protein DOY81_008407 [Sarcophaga bullata]
MKQPHHQQHQQHQQHHHHHALQQHQPKQKQYNAVTGKRHSFVSDTAMKNDEECQYDCYEMATMSNGQHCSVRRKSFAALHSLQTSLTGSSSATTTTSKKSSSAISSQRNVCGKTIKGGDNGSGSIHVNHCKCQCFKKSKSMSRKLQFSKKKLKTYQQQPDTLYLPTMCEGV